MKVLIVANGEMPTAGLVRQLAGESDLVVAADGGYDKAVSCGVSPHVVVGDLDSLSPAGRSALGPERLYEVDDPDTTDLEKAVRYSIEQGASTITIVGAGGGRADHALANLSILVNFQGQADLRLMDDAFEIRRVDGETTVDAPVGTVVSLVALGQCRGVTTRGLRWDLDDFSLAFGPRGIHNEVRQPPATVRVAAGDLLLFQGRWVEPHL